MNRRAFGKLLGAGTALPLLSSPLKSQEHESGSGYQSASPVQIGTKSQLFVDHLLVRETRDISFQLHPAERYSGNPLMVADKPWEGWRLEIFGSVIYDNEERLFKMWYVPEPVGVFAPAPQGPAGDNPTCYAISEDGLHWQKPLVGPLPALNREKTNALLFATHVPSVTKDITESDPAKRYKMICYVNYPAAERGYHTKVSPDGIHWSPFSKTPICPAGDVITGYYDKTRRMYVTLGKIASPIRGHKRRVFYLVTSADFENWTKPELVLYPDLEDDAGSLARIEQVRPMLDVPDNPAQMRTEFYGCGFHQTESCTLGFPWVITINNEARFGNQEGPFEIQLAITRDLKDWQRPFRIPCLPRGTLGDWECGIQQTAASTVSVGDEVWLYYCGANYTHGTPVLYRQGNTGRKTKYTSSIGLAKWKRDRFVSADSGLRGGTLTTVPLVFSGDRLEINARTHAQGNIQVEFLDAAQRPIEGFTISQPVQGDNLRHQVQWKDNSPAALKGRPVSIRFHIKDAELFAFAFRS